MRCECKKIAKIKLFLKNLKIISSEFSSEKINKRKEKRVSCRAGLLRESLRLYLVVIFGAIFFRFGALDSVLGSSVQYYKSRKTKNRLNLFQRRLKWRFISLTTFHNKFWSGIHFCIVLKVIEGLREIMLDFIFIRVYIYSWLSRCCKARWSSVKALLGGPSKVES